MHDSDSNEEFYSGLDRDYECFFDMEKDTLSQEDQALIYPLQEELLAVNKRYTDALLIGEGSQKYIYNVMDTATGRPVAKAVLKDVVNKDSIEQFFREARLTSLLEHPNIIAVYDMGFGDGEPFFTMELMKGSMLSQIINELNEMNPAYCEKYPQTELLDVFLRICDAMAYAHSAQILHLDLKPENIHVGEYGEVFICDWGLAKVATDDDDIECEGIAGTLEFNNMTLNGEIKGTPGFMAPEQCVSEGNKDVRTDIYALGAILYSLLTYSTSIEILHDVRDMLQKTINGDIIPPSMRKGDQVIDQRLEAIVMKALAPDPGQRYQTVGEFRSDLTKYLRGFATVAENAGFIRQLQLLVKRNRRIFRTIEISLIILFIVVTTSIVRLRASKEQALKSEQMALEGERVAKKSEELARKNEELAIKQEMLAKELLGHYEKERIERVRREKTSYKFYMSRGYGFFERGIFRKALRDAKLAKQMHPAREDAYRLEMNILIALQKFQQIAENERYKKILDPSYKLKHQLVQKYAKIKDDSRMLTDEELVEYFSDLSRYRIARRSTLIQALFCRINKGKTFSQQEVLLQKAASLLFSQSLIQYDSSIDRVTIKTHSDNVLALVSGLRLKQLDLSGAKLHTFNPIKTLAELEYLNLRDSNIASSRPFYLLRKLKYLNLEGTNITSYDLKRKAATLDYLNIAKTFVLTYPQHKVTVNTLNAVEAFHANLSDIALYPTPPKAILVTQAQLKEHDKLTSICKERGIELHIYNSVDDVAEEQFWPGL